MHASQQSILSHRNRAIQSGTQQPHPTQQRQQPGSQKTWTSTWATVHPAHQTPTTTTLTLYQDLSRISSRAGPLSTTLRQATTTTRSPATILMRIRSCFTTPPPTSGTSMTRRRARTSLAVQMHLQTPGLQLRPQMSSRLRRSKTQARRLCRAWVVFLRLLLGLLLGSLG